MDEHFSETKHLHLKMDEHFSETKHLHLKMKMLTFPKIKDDLIHFPGLRVTSMTNLRSTHWSESLDGLSE